MFTTYSAYIRHAGKRSFEIRKLNLTAPEIVVLRAIHGNDAVVNIEKTGKRDVKNVNGQTELLTHTGELDRLRQAFKDFLTEDERPLVDVLWPGYNPVLPVEIDTAPAGTRELQKDLA
jgi:hypothetical protein